MAQGGGCSKSKRLNDRVKAEAKIMKDRVEAIKARTTGQKRQCELGKSAMKEKSEMKRRVEAEQRSLTLHALRIATEQHDLASRCSSSRGRSAARETFRPFRQRRNG